MDAVIRALSPRHRRLRFALLIVVLVVLVATLIWLNQPVGAALIPLVWLLYAAIERRDERAQALAQQLAAGGLVEKLEVQPGEWGELSRAVNGLLQEQRVQQRLQPALPAPLPRDAVRALLGGNLSISGEPRMAAVLLVSYARRSLDRVERGGKPASAAWQALAYAAHEQAERHGALLHPCGDAIMLAFGAFEEQSSGEALRAALAAAEALQRSWRDGAIRAGGPLILSLASGHALALALPGLGYCVVGAPVEQAVQLQHLARHARRYGLVCSEGVYYALRHANGAGWQPTDLRIPLAGRPPQVVYGRVE